MRPRHSPAPRLLHTTWIAALGLALASEVSAAPPSAPTQRPPGRTNTALADSSLEPDGGGRLRFRGDGFTAIVHPDGSVEFSDHGGAADLNLFGLDPLRRRILDPEPERHTPTWTDVLERTLFPKVCQKCLSGRAPMFTSFGARFGGLADGPRKGRHMGAKRAFLAGTEALRLRLANGWYKARLHSELAELGGQLTALWRDSKLPLAERKRRIFERWVECEDPSTADLSELDIARLAVARSARAKIEAFVRQVAPSGSSRAYTQVELERFNRSRAGKPHFRPYDPPIASPEGSVESGAGTSVDIPTPLPADQPEPVTSPPEPALPFGPDPEPGRPRQLAVPGR